MADRLKQLGANVTLTRDSDETLTPDERVSRVLNAYGNDKDVLVISNHKEVIDYGFKNNILCTWYNI